MKTLAEIIEEIITVEGPYVDHPHDRGGPTTWGITEAVARANGYQGPMQDLQKDFARGVYRRKYWLAPGYDKVHDLSPIIAIELLDTGINMGPATASKFLQRALNVLNQNGKTYKDIVADGLIGDGTLTALKALLLSRGTNGAEVLVKLLNAQQAVRYMELAERNPTQEAFLYGWITNRIGSLS